MIHIGYQYGNHFEVMVFPILSSFRTLPIPLFLSFGAVLKYGVAREPENVTS